MYFLVLMALNACVKRIVTIRYVCVPNWANYTDEITSQFCMNFLFRMFGKVVLIKFTNLYEYGLTIALLRMASFTYGTN